MKQQGFNAGAASPRGSWRTRIVPAWFSKQPVGIILAALIALTMAFSTSATAQQSVLQKIKSSGVLKVGMAVTEPGAYKDIKTNQWTGINVDVAKRLAQLMNVKLDIVETSWNLFLPALNNGDFDIYMPGTFYTVPRALQANFSIPAYYKGLTAVVAKSDDRFNTNTFNAINSSGVRIAVRTGAVEATIAPLLFPKAKIIEFNTSEASTIAQSVKVGNADVWIADQVLQAQYLQQNPWAKVVGQPFGQSPISYVVRYGDPEWLNFVNNFVRYMRSSGEMKALIVKYGQSPTTLNASE